MGPKKDMDSGGQGGPGGDQSKVNQGPKATPQPEDQKTAGFSGNANTVSQAKKHGASSHPEPPQKPMPATPVRASSSGQGSGPHTPKRKADHISPVGNFNKKPASRPSPSAPVGQVKMDIKKKWDHWDSPLAAYHPEAIWGANNPGLRVHGSWIREQCIAAKFPNDKHKIFFLDLDLDKASVEKLGKDIKAFEEKPNIARLGKAEEKIIQKAIAGQELRSSRAGYERAIVRKLSKEGICRYLTKTYHIKSRKKLEEKAEVNAIILHHLGNADTQMDQAKLQKFPSEIRDEANQEYERRAKAAKIPTKAVPSYVDARATKAEEDKKARKEAKKVNKASTSNKAVLSLGKGSGQREGLSRMYAEAAANKDKLSYKWALYLWQGRESKISMSRSCYDQIKEKLPVDIENSVLNSGVSLNEVQYDTMWFKVEEKAEDKTESKGYGIVVCSNHKSRETLKCIFDNMSGCTSFRAWRRGE